MTLFRAKVIVLARIPGTQNRHCEIPVGYGPLRPDPERVDRLIQSINAAETDYKAKKQQVIYD